MQLSSMSLALTRAGFLAFNPLSLFSAGQPGVWYDPSDMTTLFQDEAGTTPVTAVEQPVGLMLDKSGNNLHATQSTSTSRPVLSARVNLLTDTETLATQTVTTRATTQTLRFSGAGSITLSGTATGTYTAGTHSVTTTAGSLTLTVSGTVAQADLRASNSGATLPVYQRVTTSTTYDTTDFPLYLKFDGVDDGMVTPTITPGTDKAQMFIGLRNLFNNAGVIAETSTSAGASLGALVLRGITGTPAFRLTTQGTAVAIVDTASTFVSPVTLVLSAQADISAPSATIRGNGTATTVTTGQGTGDYRDYPLYIGRRGGTTLPFNGQLYSLITRFGPNLPTATIQQTETYVAQKTGITL
jgi:hypothetical protein